jgi:hypothetical protein
LQKKNVLKCAQNVPKMCSKCAQNVLMNNKRCAQKTLKMGKNNTRNAPVLFHKFICYLID